MTVAARGGTGWPDDPAQHEQDLRLESDQTVAELVPAEWAGFELLDALTASVGLSVIVDPVTEGSVVGVIDEVGDSWFTVRGPDAVTLIAASAVMTIRNLAAFSPEQAGDHRLRQSAVWRLWARQRKYIWVQMRSGTSLGGSVRRVGRDFVELLEHPADRQPGLGDRSVVVSFGAVVTARTAG